MARILIADDHEIVRRGLRRVLEEERDWEVVAEAADGKEAIQKALATSPDVAILDYGLPVINGVEATRQIRERSPQTEVLIFTMHDRELIARDLLAAGARGYLLKSDAGHSLVEAVRALVHHRPFFTASLSEIMLNAYLGDISQGSAGEKTSVLSRRERGVVQLIAEGNTNKQIALILNISPKTVEAHRAAVMRKLGLSSAAELVRYAVRNHIVQS